MSAPARPPEVATERVVAPDEDGRTVAAIVRVAMNVPWSRAKQLCTRGCVTIDGVLVRDDTRRVEAGRTVAIDPRAKAPPPESENELSRDRIVWLDSEVVVVDKPADLQTVPFDDDDHDSLVQRLTVEEPVHVSAHTDRNAAVESLLATAREARAQGV